MHPLLISASELQTQLGKTTVVIDCRFNLTDKTLGRNLYREGHIPGAFYADLEQDLSSTVQVHGGRHPLPDFKNLEATLRSFGISQQTTVVIYDDSRMAFAARAWWLLSYMGHKNVRILNGGYKAWLVQKGAIDRREPAPKQGNFKMDLQLNQTVDYSAICDDQSLTLIDSREPRRFQGLEEPIDPVAGHIPRALNFFWQNITDEDGFMKPIDWQKQYWNALPTKQHLAVYCGSGVTACANIFSLYLCGVDAKLYPGSWSDWCSYLPTPATPK